MPISRIYQPVSLQAQSIIKLDEKASHHLARVLRAEQGDELTIFNGNGGEYSAVITSIGKKYIEIKVLDFMPRDVESPIGIHLAQGIAKGEKMDFIVQKAVELGVTTITPLITERCNVRLDQEREEKRLQHWQAVVTSACEQSGRNHLPQLTAPISLKEWVKTIKADACFVLSPHVHQTFKSIALPTGAMVVLLIGPEGGLSETEIELAQTYGFLPLQLGPRVMRTETATIAAISILQSHFGDM